MNDSKEKKVENTLENASKNETEVVETKDVETQEKPLSVADFSETNENAVSTIEEVNLPKDTLIMKSMTKEHVLDVMSVPSYSYSEYRMVTFLIRWCRSRNIACKLDTYGNIYVTKGELAEGEFYPCVTSHLDTVQDKQKPYAEAGMPIPIKETVEKGKHKIYVDGMGIGADCRAGIVICLAIIEKFDKIKGCFFLQEEVGMLGSAQLDKSWFNDVGYVIGYDSPDLNRAAWKCSGEKLFDRDFYTEHLEAICDKWGLNDFRSEPITDVVQIRKKTDITCMNFGNGGYNAHMSNEYCYLEDMDHACGMGMELVEHLGCKKYAVKAASESGDSEFYDKKAGRKTYSYSSGNYGGCGGYGGGGYHYSGGTSSVNSSTNQNNTTHSEPKKDEHTVPVESIKYISDIYEERISSIKEALKTKCEEMKLDFAKEFAPIFAEEIKF